jgi:hypothetical protein
MDCEATMTTTTTTTRAPKWAMVNMTKNKQREYWPHYMPQDTAIHRSKQWSMYQLPSVTAMSPHTLARGQIHDLLLFFMRFTSCTITQQYFA